MLPALGLKDAAVRQLAAQHRLEGAGLDRAG
jgi:hypothetical protein